MPFAEPTILTGFWSSVTMYDGITKLAVQNPINRYSLGSNNVLKNRRVVHDVPAGGHAGPG
jgi:hypothetical protein